jgi:hypothetical protein
MSRVKSFCLRSWFECSGEIELEAPEHKMVTTFQGPSVRRGPSRGLLISRVREEITNTSALTMLALTWLYHVVAKTITLLRKCHHTAFMICPRGSVWDASYKKQISDGYKIETSMLGSRAYNPDLYIYLFCVTLFMSKQAVGYILMVEMLFFVM